MNWKVTNSCLLLLQTSEVYYFHDSIKFEVNQSDTYTKATAWHFLLHWGEKLFTFVYTNFYFKKMYSHTQF